MLSQPPTVSQQANKLANNIKKERMLLRLHLTVLINLLVTDFGVQQTLHLSHGLADAKTRTVKSL